MLLQAAKKRDEFDELIIRRHRLRDTTGCTLFTIPSHFSLACLVQSIVGLSLSVRSINRYHQTPAQMLPGKLVGGGGDGNR